jgi:riboflavin kinase/FMN adenylyltransferase
MKIIRGSNNLRGRFRHPVLTFGNFDGLHRGHVKIIEKVVSLAKAGGRPSVVYTFDPHPVRILSPELAPRLLQTAEQKTRMLGGLGINAVIFEPFTAGYAKLGARQFFDRIIKGRIGAAEIVIGYDFTFGVHRTGKAEDLEKFAGDAGIRIHVVNAVFQGESLLSSTHIRHFVEKGEMEDAAKMLGRPYSITGSVVSGRGIGAKLGFHTANLKPENELIPPPGVYVTAAAAGGKKRMSVTNVGYNPTFGGTALSIETYILDFDGHLQGRRIELEFHKKIRREMTFESIDALRREIRKDVSKTRKYYEKKRRF